MTIVKAFKDLDFWENMYQYFDEKGIQWRRDCQDKFQYKFYKEEDNAFLYQGSMIKPTRRLSIKKTHQEFLNQ